MKPTYAPADAAYLAKRRLRRHARVWHLWAMGVGAVISGDFFGWNFGLAAGGFGGMLAAVVVMTVMYIGLCFSIAEMSPALPHAGGAYSFARTSMGPWAGYITGLAENMEYILTPAVIVVGIGGYLGAVAGTSGAWEPAWWLLCYGVFVALNIWGVEMTFHVSVAVTLVALAVLAVFWVGAVPHFDLGRWAAPYFPPGRGRVSSSLVELPFALWLYLGIEQLPLAAEESHDPKRDMPRGILYGLVTLIAVSFLTVVLSVGIAPGAAQVATSNEPLFLGFQTIFGLGLKSRLLALAACTGLVASFHTIIFAYGRQIYSLSRAGYFPTWLSVTHGTRATPQRALLAGSVLGFAAALVIHLTPQGSPVGAVLLNMAVFGAVLAYILQMVSFIVLRLRFPRMERPYVSPLGIGGAAVAVAIAAATLVTLFRNPDYNKGVIGAAIWFVLGLAYFAIYGRHRLILAPEEESAFRHRGQTPLMNLRELLAKASPLRSGDQLAGIAAGNAEERVRAQMKLADLPLKALLAEPLIPYEEDEVTRLICDGHDPAAFAPASHLTVGEFRDWLLSDQATPERLAAMAPGLTPEMAAAVCKIMRLQDLVTVGAKCRVVTRFRSTIGLPGRLSTRLQPNHPTDDLKGIAASILDGLSYGSGDAVIGVNPATDNLGTVEALLHLLDRIRDTYAIPTQTCVLAHVTTQMQALQRGAPVDLVFQSVAGTEAANASFGINLALLDEAHQAARELRRGHNVMYFETGQGSALSANAHHGVDQQTCEARAYGVARRYAPLLVNTVVGFIGPEYLYDGKQIVRAGLEDHFCGKLLGVPMGCDICYTNHAEADQDDMDALLTLLGVAGCSYIMGVPGADDVMLHYQSTSFHDALYVRSVLHLKPAPEFEAWLERRPQLLAETWLLT